MAYYSAPFRLYLVLDPRTGKRRQLADRRKAELLAHTISKATRTPVSRILTPSRFWYTRRYVGDGKVKRINTGQTLKHEAQDWIDERSGLARVGVSEPRKQGFSAAVDSWLEIKRVKRLSDQTLRDYTSVSGFWKAYLGSQPVSEITRDDLSRYFAERGSGRLGDRRDEHGKLIKPGLRVLQKDRVLLGSFFRWAQRGGLCVGNPVALLDETFTPEEREVRALEADEVHRLLAACRDPYKLKLKRTKWREYETEVDAYPPPYLYSVVLIGLSTLLRLGAILRLTWEDIDLKRGEIRVRQAKNKRAIRVPMTVVLKTHLESLPRETPESSVFGTPVSSVKKSFRSACQRAGVPWATFHVLRKTSATMLLNAGVPIKVVQRLGNWKTTSVLLKHYAAATAEEQTRALGVLDEHLS